MDLFRRTYVTYYDVSGLGGAETLHSRIVNYLAASKCKLYMIASERDYAYNQIPKELLGNIIRIPVDGKYLSTKNNSLKEKKEIQELVKTYLSLNDTILLAYAPYFNNLQITMMIFESFQHARLFTSFLHPESWPRAIFSWPSVYGKSIRPLRKNSLYYYQRELLKKLDTGSANWFMNDVTKKYHEFYYDVELPNSRVIPLPFDIPEIDPVVLNRSRKNSDILKVVWLGRFEYFKNPSIKKAYEALDRLTEKHKDLKVEFDLIGYGSEKYEKDIRKEVKTSGRLQVKYLGKIFPDRLPEVIAQYDVGVAMGTSALHIGVMGIPTIYVDASDENHYKEIKGCWLHREPIGLGSGVYGDIAGFRIDGREDMRILFEEMIAAPNLLEDYGVKDRNYVIENYDENKIMPQIIDAWTSSTFSPGDMEVYRYPPLKRFIRRTARKILRR